MNLAMLVRCENRGLGNLTWEAHRHLTPAKTLVVMMGPGGYTPYAERPERYPGARRAVFDGTLPDEDIDWLLDGTDVLYTAETPYDYRLLERARERGVATVVHGMFEFLRWRTDPDLPRPDLFLAPSTWHLEDWPAPTELLRFPVARDRLPFTRRDEALTFLHVAGHPAMADRNGTRVVLSALTWVRQTMRVVIRAQGRAPRLPRVRKNVELEIEQGDVENYWDLYAGADVLVAPRRYGGLSLPMQEAASLGMPVISLAVEPQVRWLPRGTLVAPSRGRPLKVQGSTIQAYDVDPRRIAARMDLLAATPELVGDFSEASDRAAAAISWDATSGPFRDVLGRAAAGVPVG